MIGTNLALLAIMMYYTWEMLSSWKLLITSTRSLTQNVCFSFPSSKVLRSLLNFVKTAASLHRVHSVEPLFNQCTLIISSNYNVNLPAQSSLPLTNWLFCLIDVICRYWLSGQNVVVRLTQSAGPRLRYAVSGGPSHWNSIELIVSSSLNLSLPVGYSIYYIDSIWRTYHWRKVTKDGGKFHNDFPLH